MSNVEAITRALLYEGYILWPYTKSATKNQQRWTFGGVYPEAYALQSGGADRSTVRTEVLVESTGEKPALSVTVRFLQVIARQVVRVTSGNDERVSELNVAGERYISWDEASEREAEVSLEIQEACAAASMSLNMEPGCFRLPLFENGEEVGAVIRSWEGISGILRVNSARLNLNDQPGIPLHRVAVTISNLHSSSTTSREEAVRFTFVSAHVILRASDATFISQTDPPERLETYSAENANDGLWPVLVDNAEKNDTMLASPIILDDFPRIAPESPGDLFDGGEIDQLLVLNVLSLTEEEQREMRDSDPKAREILDRCKSLTNEQLMRLHGTLRSNNPPAAASPQEAVEGSTVV